MQFATICKFTLTNLQSNLYMHIYQINIKVPDSNFWLKIIGQNLKSKLKNHKKQILWVLFICRVYWISNRTSNWALRRITTNFMGFSLWRSPLTFVWPGIPKVGWLGLIRAPSNGDRNAIWWYFALIQLLFSSRIVLYLGPLELDRHFREHKFTSDLIGWQPSWIHNKWTAELPFPRFTLYCE